MILVFPFSTFGAGFTPEFIEYLRKVGLTFGKVSAIDKLNCRIAESARKVGAGFRKYPAKQG